MRRITLARVSSCLLGFLFLVALSARPSQASCAVGQFNTPSLVFGQQPVGTSGLTQTATLTFMLAAGCPSPDSITITGIAVSGTNPTDFTAAGCSGTFSVATGAPASCTLGGIFTPTATGTRTAIINVTWADSDSTSPSATTLNVVGGDEVVYVTTGLGGQVLTVDGTTGAFQILYAPVCGELGDCFNPTGAVVGPDSKIYMTDQVNSTIWRMNQDGSQAEEVYQGGSCPDSAPCLVEGPSFSASGTGDLYFNTYINAGLYVIPGVGTTTFGGPFNAPASVTESVRGGTGTAFDANGNLLAADAESEAVWTIPPPYTTATELISAATSAVGVGAPAGIALNKSTGQTFVADPGALMQPDNYINAIFQVIPPAAAGLPYTTAAYYTFPGGMGCEEGNDNVEYIQFDMTGHLFATTSTYPISFGDAASNGCGKVWRIDPGTLPTATLLVDLNAAYTDGIPNVCTSPCGLNYPQAIGVAIGPTQGPTQTVNLLPTGGTYSVGIPVGCTPSELPPNNCSDTITGVYPAGIYSLGDTMNITFNEEPATYLTKVGASSPYSMTTLAPVAGWNGWGIVPTLVCRNGSGMACDDTVTPGTSYEIFTTWQSTQTDYCSLIPHLLRGDPPGGPYSFLVDTLVNCTDGGVGTKGKSTCQSSSSSSCASDWLNSFGAVTGSTAGVIATATITSPTNGASFILNQPATATFACGQNPSTPSIVVSCPGIVTNPAYPSTVISVTSGGPLPTTLAGTNTLSVTAEVDGGSPGPGATAQYTVVPCQDVSLAFNPSTVALGKSTTVTASLQSCNSSRENAVLQFTLTGPFGKSCGMSQTLVLSLPWILGPTPLTFEFPLNFDSPLLRGACPGSYTVSVGTYVKGTLVDTTTSSLVVTP
jgi:hypothetical protein